MPRVQPQLMRRDELKEILEEFWLAVASLETKGEVESFFRDLLSNTESLMLARRLRIAKLLLQGKSYEQIKGSLKTSQTTIAGVQRWMQSGFGGYEASIPRLEKMLQKVRKEKKRKAALRDPFSFDSLKRRYPLHFLLFNMFEELSEGKSKDK